MKKFAAVLFAVVILFLAAVPLPAHADVAAVRSRRVVSVMYDDSGSMSGEKWAGASYSMQAFTAMLNPEDALVITYMSENTSSNPQDWVSRKVDLRNPQAAVDAIRAHTDTGNTPVGALEQAFNALTAFNDTNPNTEYWLVAFTDGAFNEEGNDEITERLKRYAQKDMPNGSQARIFFMTIGDLVNMCTPSDGGMSNIDVRRALTTDDVTDDIFSIAAEISGRYQVSSSDIAQTDDRTLTVSSALPLFNIGVLTQNSSAKVERIRSSEGADVSIKSNVAIKAPGAENASVGNPTEQILKMNGHVALAGKANQILPAGKYTITFSESVSEKDVAVLLEPAIELRIRILKDGAPLPDDYVITEHETGLSADAALYEYGTDNAISPSLMPDGVEYAITHTENGAEAASAASLELDPLSVTTGESEITASASLPGFFHLTARKVFTPEHPVVTRIDAEVYPDGSKRLSPSDGPEVVYLTDIGSNRTGIRFTLYEDDTPIDPARAKQLLDAFNAGISADFRHYETEILPDGSYLVYPTKGSGLFYNPLFDWIFHHGPQKVGVDLNGAHAEGRLTFRLGRGWVLPLLKLLIPLYLLWWFLFKKHFPKGTLLHLYGRRDSFDDTVYYKEDDDVRLSWFGAVRHRNILLILPRLLYLLLPMPSKVRFHGYTFTGQKSFIRRFNQHLVVRNVYGKSVSTSSRNPSGQYPDSKVDLDTQLYIKETSGAGTQYDGFKLD